MRARPNISRADLAATRARLAVAVLLAAPLAGGCGPTPPQAPHLQARKLDQALGGIATACGEAYQVTAFPGDHRRDLAILEASASGKARELASVYAHNPAWIYQSETIRQLVHDAVSTLQECGLLQAATALTRATTRRRDPLPQTRSSR